MSNNNFNEMYNELNNYPLFRNCKNNDYSSVYECFIQEIWNKERIKENFNRKSFDFFEASYRDYSRQCMLKEQYTKSFKQFCESIYNAYYEVKIT